jgi:hypothetical protein
MALTPEQLAKLQREGMYVSDYNTSGMSPEVMALMGLTGDPNSYYTYGNGGERGDGKYGDRYSILDAEGNDTGKQGMYSSSRGLGKEALMYAALLAGAGAAGGAFAGMGIPGIGGAGATGATGATGAAGAAGPWAGFGVAGDAYLPGAMSIGGSVGSAAPLAGLEAYLVGGGAAAAGGAAGAASGGGAGTLGTMAPLETLSTAGGQSLPGMMAPAAGGGGLLSGAASALKGAGSWLAPIVGAALGSQPTTTENNTTKKMDPRMDALVYGDGGFLNNATDWYKANKSGMNDEMRNAIAQNRSLLNDPATMQGYKNMATQGQGLLNRPVASNPFTSPQDQRPQFGSNLLQRYLNGGLLGQ